MTKVLACVSCGRPQDVDGAVERVWCSDCAKPAMDSKQQGKVLYHLDEANRHLREMPVTATEAEPATSLYKIAQTAIHALTAMVEAAEAQS